MERRRFLQLTSYLTTTALVNPVEIVGSLTQDQSDQKPANLESYQNYLNEEKTDFEENIISQIDLFANYSPITRERQSDDFNLYYPIYRAAEIEYGVPWLLLWVMHIQETQVSTHPNPGAGGYEGAMQRNPKLFSFHQTLEASQNWELLKDLPQRYSQGYAPFRNDYREILWCGMHLPQRAHEFYPNLSFEEGILQTVRFNYSAAIYGSQRVDQFLKIRPLFEPYKRLL